MLATLDHPYEPWCGTLELAPYVEEATPSAAAYRRRRLAAALLLALVVVGLGYGLRWVAAPLGGDTAPASGGEAIHVVQPGDSAWSIARSLQPEGDLRPLVDALLAANGGSPVLAVGQRLVVPAPG